MAYNILIVDDSRTIRAVLRKTLTLSQLDLGEIFEAGNGQEALDCLKDNWVDLVLSDLNMPVMSGMELVKKMSEDGLLHEIPVIVISTEGSATRIEELKQRGIREYIRKPFTPEAIGDIIRTVLGVIHEQS